MALTISTTFKYDQFSRYRSSETPSVDTSLDLQPGKIERFWSRLSRTPLTPIVFPVRLTPGSYSRLASGASFRDMFVTCQWKQKTHFCFHSNNLEAFFFLHAFFVKTTCSSFTQGNIRLSCFLIQSDGIHVIIIFLRVFVSVLDMFPNKHRLPSKDCSRVFEVAS